MKRIKFTELGFKKNLNGLITVIGLIISLLGLMAFFSQVYEKFWGLLNVGVLILLFPQLKNLFYKNYFLWNEKGGNIKINSKS